MMYNIIIFLKYRKKILGKLKFDEIKQLTLNLKNVKKKSFDIIF